MHADLGPTAYLFRYLVYGNNSYFMQSLQVSSALREWDCFMSWLQGAAVDYSMTTAAFFSALTGETRRCFCS